MDDLISTFEELLRSYGSVDMAEAEFKRLIADDSDLHEIYREWCEENGLTERRGFLDWSEDFIANQNSVWDSLHNEYDL